MGDVINLKRGTTPDVTPDMVIQTAIEAGLKEVLIIGVMADGSFFFDSDMTIGDAYYALGKVKQKLLEDD